MRIAKKKLVSVALAVMTVSGVLGTASSADAALPLMSCRKLNEDRSIAREFAVPGIKPVWMCVGNQDNRQNAWLGLETGANWRAINDATMRVELVHFSFNQFPYGGATVWPSNDWFSDLDGWDIRSSPTVAHWYPGVFCARLYNRSTDVWRDIHCVDTNGVVRN